MKKIKGIFVLVSIFFISLFTVGCTQNDNSKQNLKTYSYELSVDNFESLDLRALETNQPMTNKPLQAFLNEIRNAHLKLQTTKNDVKALYFNLNNLKNQFKSTEQTLSEEDRYDISQAIQSLHIKRLLLRETKGQGYLQLSLVIDNHSDYDNETIKTMLTDVYLVFQSRTQIYEDIHETFLSIISILNKYLET
ncbi:MAG: hypothetical protein R6U15_06145 [Candidatus Izemoplasmatales bacterium]